MRYRKARSRKAYSGLMLLTGVGVAVAQPVNEAPPVSAPVNAAQLDWRPRPELPETTRREIPAFCQGAYVQPAYGRGDRLPRVEFEGKSSDMPVYADAESSSYLPGGQAEFRGGVELEQGNYWMTGTRATYDERQQIATVHDGVLVRGPNLLVTGQEARYNATTGYFELDQASYLVHDLELRGTAELISRPQTNELVIRDGVYTTCAPHDEDWSLKANRIVLDRDAGFGTAYHAVLRVEDIPVAYVPYITFPIDDRRKSGFLYPSIGTSNTGRGIAFSTPYYFNLAPNYDATYTPSYIHGRGLLSELEGRHLHELSYTEARIGFIDRDEDYRKEVPNGNAYRWALDFENETTYGNNWYSEIDFNAVSDDDYLSDLNRDLSIDSATHLDRYWQLTYATESWAFQSRVQGFQTIDPIYERPYMQLPELTFEGLWLTDQVEYELFSEYSYFWRDAEKVQAQFQSVGYEQYGSRWRASPRIAAPLQNVWGYFIPALRLDYTQYLLEDRLPEQDDTLDRTVPFYTADAGIYLDRSLSILGEAFNQSLEPRLFYVYSPARDQREFPNFDTTLNTFSYSQLFRDDRFAGGDRVGDNNRLTLGVTTRFTEMATGIERARVSLGQIYHFEQRQVWLDPNRQERRGESVLAGEAVAVPSSLWDIRVEGLWDPREQRTEQGSTTLSFHTSDYAYLLNLSHRYIGVYQNGTEERAGYLEQTDISTIFPVTSQISLIGRWLYNLPNHRTIGTLLGMEYSSCCWRLQLVAQSYLEDTNLDAPSELDRGVFLRFFLKGLTGVGSGSEATLRNAIVGYDTREQLLMRRRPASPYVTQ